MRSPLHDQLGQAPSPAQGPAPKIISRYGGALTAPVRAAVWQAPLIALLAWDIGFLLLGFWLAGLIVAQASLRWRRWYMQLPLLVLLIAGAAYLVPVRTADFFITLLVALLPLTWRLEGAESGAGSGAGSGPTDRLSPAGLTPTIFLVGAVFLYQIQFFILLLVIVWLLVFLLWYCMALTGFRLDSLSLRWVPVLAISATVAAVIVGLFIAVPRISTGFIPGFTPQQQKIALTDHVAPGGMRDLLADETIAFRAVPQKADNNGSQYWRVFVLAEEQDGRWQRGGKRPAIMPYLTAAPVTHRYALLLDDHDPSTLPAPGWPAGFSSDYAYSAAGELLTERGANPRRVTVSGSDEAMVAQETLNGKKPAGIIISEANPRLIEWAEQVRSDMPDDAAFIQHLMEEFAGRFSYDTTISLSEDGALDAFFFDSRRGYCAYFATAMATALRAAGIEANVVMGYQGGQWNAFGGFWTVRNADAHAWVEARPDEGGWQRFDPTNVVRSGLGPAMASTAMSATAVGDRADAPTGIWARLAMSGQWFDALNTRLTLAIMDYGQSEGDAEAQTNDRAALVFIVIALAMAGVVVVAGVAVWLRRGKQGDRLERRLERLLVNGDQTRQRHAGETIIAFAERITGDNPVEIRKAAGDLAAAITRLRHAPQPDLVPSSLADDFRELGRLVRAFVPPKSDEMTV